MGVRKRGSDHEPGAETEKPGGAQKVEMKKQVGIISGISFVAGIMIGSGIFISPKGVLREVGSVGGSLVVWLLGGIVCLIGAICYAELGCMLKESGADYTYQRVGLGKPFGYMFGWQIIVALKPSSAAIIALTCSEYILASFTDDGCGIAPDVIRKCLAIAVIVLVAAINCWSVRVASNVQIFFTAAKLIALAIIVVGGIVRLAQGYTTNLDPATSFEGTTSNPGKWAVSIYSSLWAYDGWNNLNFLTEEIKNLKRNLPLSIFIAIPMVIVIYILTNVSYFTVMTAEELLDSPAVAVTWADTVIPSVRWIIPLAVAMSTFGALNGTMFTAGRINYVASRHGHMIEILSMIHVKRITPVPGIVFNALVGCIFVVAGDILTLIDFFSFAAWIFTFLTVLSLLVLRYRMPHLERPIKVPLILPILEMVFALFLVIAPLIGDPRIEFLYAALFIVGGFIFYIPFVHFELQPPFMAPITLFLQILMEVSPVEGAPVLVEEIQVNGDIQEEKQSDLYNGIGLATQF